MRDIMPGAAVEWIPALHFILHARPKEVAETIKMFVQQFSFI
jgi:hypothetical protein